MSNKNETSLVSFTQSEVVTTPIQAEVVTPVVEYTSNNSGGNWWLKKL